MCDEHSGIRSNARALAGARDAQRAAIASALGVPDDQVVVHVRPMVSDVVRAHLTRARELRRHAVTANAAAAGERRAAARVLHAEGLPLRDIGTILGVSHQRAHQLLRGPGGGR